MTRVLLLGGSGQLGTAIRSRWSDWSIAAPPHADVDIEDAEAVRRAIDASHADVVINCAAFHNVDRCEEEPQRAMAINAAAVGSLASACEASGATFVTVSTDYVFDGEASRPYVESDEPRPISAYGASKLAGERLAALWKKSLIVRTCGVYGTRPSASKGYTFIDRILAQAKAGEPVRVVSGIVASPSYAGHLAEMLRGLLEAGSLGLFHACNAGAVSWYEFSREALRQAGLPPVVEPLSVAQWKAAARRPIYSALSCERMESFDIHAPSWEEGIAAYLNDR